MAQTSRTFRIFISSTFSDLKEEQIQFTNGGTQ
jgi:hypothetical protein